MEIKILSCVFIQKCNRNKIARKLGQEAAQLSDWESLCGIGFDSLRYTRPQSM